MATRLEDGALKQLFLEARTHRAWQPRDVPDNVLKELVDLMKMGPTASNCQPARLVFVKSREAKERLKPHLSEGNRDKTMAAPATAIVAHDLDFHAQLSILAPHAPHMKDYFGGLPVEGRAPIASQGSSLQGAYVMLAARALGLDCGPMGGFNKEGVDTEFLSGTNWKSNFLINLGFGDPAGVRPRAPRLEFSFAARII